MGNVLFSSITAFFALGLVGWGAARFLTWPLPELARRAFWVVVVVLLLLPNFLPRALMELANTSLWPLAAGLASGELFVHWFRRQQDQWRVRRAEKQAKRAARAAQHAADERKATRRKDS